MGSFKALTLAGAVLAAGAIQSASAADLLPPPPAIDAPLRGTVSESSGWYLRGDAGAGISGSTKLKLTFDPGHTPDGIHTVSQSRQNQAFVGLGVGYRFNNWFRADVTGEMRWASRWSAKNFYNCNGGLCPDWYSSRIGSGVFLANGYVDLGTWSGLTPFVGAGIGLARHTFSELLDTAGPYPAGFGVAPARSVSALAWALMAGIGYDFSPNLKLELGYRYLDAGRAKSDAIICRTNMGCPFERQSVRVTSHDIRLGMRWMFNDTPAMPMMASAPLVRKY